MLLPHAVMAAHLQVVSVTLQPHTPRAAAAPYGQSLLAQLTQEILVGLSLSGSAEEKLPFSYTGHGCMRDVYAGGHMILKIQKVNPQCNSNAAEAALHDGPLRPYVLAIFCIATLHVGDDLCSVMLQERAPYCVDDVCERLVAAPRQLSRHFVWRVLEFLRALLQFFLDVVAVGFD